jgi:hypothetical protein
MPRAGVKARSEPDGTHGTKWAGGAAQEENAERQGKRFLKKKNITELCRR